MSAEGGTVYNGCEQPIIITKEDAMRLSGRLGLIWNEDAGGWHWIVDRDSDGNYLCRPVDTVLVEAAWARKASQP